MKSNCLMQVKVQLNIDCTVHLVSQQVHMSSSLLYFSFFTVLDLQGRRLSACSWTRAAPARSLPEPAIRSQVHMFWSCSEVDAFLLLALTGDTIPPLSALVLLKVPESILDCHMLAFHFAVPNSYLFKTHYCLPLKIQIKLIIN